MTYTVQKPSVGRVKGEDRRVYVQWKDKKYKQTSSYEYDWEYYDGKRWLPGSNGSSSVADADVGKGWYRNEWNAPDVATHVRARVKPVSKKKGKKGKYYSAGWTKRHSYNFTSDALPIPDIKAELDDDGVTASINVKSDDADCHYADIWWYSGSKKVGGKDDYKCDGECTYKMTMTLGVTWKFYARVRSTKDTTKGVSGWTEAVTLQSKPGKPTKASASATDSNAAKVTWGSGAGAKTYTVERVADDSSYFNSNPDEVVSVDGIVGTTFLPTGLETGHTWYFRVKAVNDSGESAWSNIASTVLATVPDAPTTFDTEAAFIVGDTVRLRWTHNSEDSSEQEKAEIELKVNGSTETVSVTDDAYRDLSLSGYTDGSQVEWRVRTKGAHPDWSPWSATRSFSVYERPSLMVVAMRNDGTPLDESTPLNTYPLRVQLDASGGGNEVSGYHISIISASETSYTDDYGEDVTVAAGEAVFDSDFGVQDDPFVVDLQASDGLFLRNATDYSIVADVSMQSGLRATSDAVAFTVDFDSTVPEPDAVVYFDSATLTATVTPACYADDADGMQTDTLLEGITLSVLRLSQDGTVTMLQRGIENNGLLSVIDPHADFDECWYRIVATETATGMSAVSEVYELSPHPTCCIQWDERFSVARMADEVDEDEIEFAGVRIDGLYNLGFDESGSVQADDVEYIGRKFPVSYYGTQKGYTSTYQLEFPKEDYETYRKARRLQGLLDDVYIREPSGVGFWAHCQNVRLSRSYDSMSVKLSVDAVRVDRADSAIGGE